MSEPKQALIARSDLKMPKGKLAAQMSHASVAALLSQGERDGNTLTIQLREDQIPWIEGSHTKVSLKVQSEDELVYLYDQAMELGLPAALIRDEGRTVFTEPTLTCCAIGPADGDLINKVTSTLKLL